MSKDKIIKFNKVKPNNASELLQQVFLDEKEQAEMDPLEKLAVLSTNLKAGQTLPLRRETVLKSIDVVDKSLVDISKWKALFEKEGFDFTQQLLGFDSANSIIHGYLSYYDKKLRKPIAGSGQLAQARYYVKKFREYETKSDVFADMSYQPFIFLRQWAAMVTDIALSISVTIHSHQEWVSKNREYFPRCERFAFRDTQRDAERKLRWVESQQEVLSKQQLEAEVSAHAKEEK